ncbi:ABC transporter substrate-binding protein [Phytohabitans kaempferiae]|uniref:ABC transporter substrate-binding protein n=1 Tax=Phytohabitans kaempferiae TaxID=1620943 RepID=A0ABV6LYW9_9ACTN
MRYLATAAALLLSVTACGGDSGSDSGAAAGPTKIKIGVSPNVNVAGMQIGIDQGKFTARELAVELDSHQSSSASVPLLLNNQWQMTTAGAATVISAIAEGVDLKIVSSVSYNVVTDDGASRATLVRANSGITTFQQVKGKLGVNGLGSSLDIHTRATIDKAGGDSKQLTSVEIPQSNAVAALRDGTVDAITVTQPFAYRASQDPSLRSLGDPAISALDSEQAPIIYTVVAGSFAEKNAEALRQFVEALGEASTVANDDPQAARQAASKLTELPVEQLAKIPLPGYGTEIDRDVLQHEIDVLVQYGDLAKEKAPSVDDLLWKP